MMTKPFSLLREGLLSRTEKPPAMIGVIGYAQHGKDTIGRILVEQHGFIRFAFADALKSMALVLNPIVTTRQRLGDVVGPEKNWESAKQIPEVRRFLQVLGTEAVRGHLGGDAWINALERKITDSGARRIVITDVRFLNEAMWVHSLGGTLIRVSRIEPDGSAFDNGLPPDHPSEAQIPELPADFFIESVSGDFVGISGAVARTLEVMEG